MLGGIDSVASFITVNKQSQSNGDYNFHSSIAIFAPEDYIFRFILLLAQEQMYFMDENISEPFPSKTGFVYYYLLQLKNSILLTQSLNVW